MAAIRKFLFETVFDEEDGIVIEASVDEVPEDSPEEEAVIEEEVVPTFSEEDVAAAHQQGFAAGKEEGHRAAMGTTESHLAEALSAVAGRIGELFDIQAQANALAAADAVSVATVMVRKIFPDLTRRNALGEIENMVETAMQRVMDEPRLIIRVHGDIRQDIEERLAAVTAANGYEGRLVVIGDDEIAHADCRIEWTDGGAERDSAALWQELDSIIEQNLGRTDLETTDEASVAQSSESMAGDADAAGPPPAVAAIIPDEGTTAPAPDDVKEMDEATEDLSGPIPGIDQPAPTSGNGEAAADPGDAEPAPVPGDSTRDN